MDVQEFDLVIVGAGSGNSIPQEGMDDWRIAIVERDAFGGTCLNRGCIPSKMFVLAADAAETAHTAHRLGVDASVDGVRWPEIVDRVFGRIDPIAAGGERYRRSLANTTVFTGDARFVAHKTLEVDGQRITARHIVLAVGARTVVPAIPGLVDVPFHTSDDIMRLPALPEHLVIVGGGFIANEMGHVFASLGSKVTMITRGPRLLGAEDDEISAAFTELMSARAHVLLDAKVHTAHRTPDGGVRLDVEGRHGHHVVDGDALLIAVGRHANGDVLHLAATGLEADVHGCIATDEHLQTAVPGIWALGDVTGRHQLKHMANGEARVVSHNLLHPDALQAVDHRPAPHAVFTSPQIAACGLTERAAMASGQPYRVARRHYSSTAYGWALEDTTSFVKVLADPATGLIVGAHAMGPHASIVIQPLVQAMHLGNTVEQVARGVIYLHPALSEVVEQVLLELC
jgi:mycothione reductase